MSEVLVFLCSVIVVMGALLCAFAKSGPQETLGGVILSVGLLGLMAGGLLWSFGL